MDHERQNISRLAPNASLDLMRPREGDRDPLKICSAAIGDLWLMSENLLIFSNDKVVGMGYVGGTWPQYQASCPDPELQHHQNNKSELYPLQNGLSK